VDDTVLVVVVLVAAIGGLAFVARLLEGRRRAKGSALELPEFGPIGRAMMWVVRILVVVMVLAIVGFFVLQKLWLMWVAAGTLLLYLVFGRIAQVLRLTGK
jgi:hypothetical protein